ncbi:helix-turn-helix transcriptional regulator [Psychromicrobium lacuslunae]|uniref:HTH luxR-type domain-containing protein n=1 Tax=Psychromicrobium lacuslunae TaxID=1618207 RepID=A0A0D4C1L5_9MICC|nr:LuxR family transcriptional regulator [Psychromicrobium lacuslunae]AJT42246.1 hypothetical protein UM93_13430 [Psychromicrobium lacuslunae]
MNVPVSSPTMIGREADLSVLRQLFEVVDGGEPRGIVLSGEAGIGKTRLITDFRREVKDSALVIRGQCVDLGQVATPYAPVIDLLRDLVGQLGAVAVLDAAGPGRDTLAALLPSLASNGEIGSLESSSGSGGLGRLHETVAVVLETLAQKRTVVAIVEDLHWADTATLRLLSFVVRALSCDRVMLLLSYRSEDVPRGHPVRGFLTELDRTRRVARHDIGRLSRDQVAAQAQAIVGSAPASAAIDRVFERSEGVPFFVEELLGLDETCSGDDLPDTLRELLLARYERLSTLAQKVLRLISVGGMSVDHQLLERIFDGDLAELELSLREAVSESVLIAEADSYTFRHALVREAIYADLLPGERLRFHAGYAVELARTATAVPSSAEISYHWMSARNAQQAFPATVAAMQEAHAGYAFASEAQLAERLLELWDQLPDAAELAGVSRVELMRRAASALRNAGDSDRAISTLDAALADPEPREALTQVKLLRDKAMYLTTISRSGSLELLEQALTLLPADAPAYLRASLLNNIAARQMIMGNYREAIRVSGEVERIARGHSARDLSIAASISGCSLAQLGELDEGLKTLASAEPLAEGDASALLRYRVNASDMTNLLGRYEESAELAIEGIRRAKAVGVERSSGAIMASNAVEPLMALGRWAEAEEMLDRTLALEPPLAFQIYLRQSKMLLTLWQGDPERSMELYRGWRAATERLAAQELQTRMQSARATIEVLLSAGDLETAWQQTRYLTVEHCFAPAYDLPLLGIAARLLARVRERVSGSGFAIESSLAGLSAEELAATEAQWRNLLEDCAFWPTAASWRSIFDAELGGSAGIGDDPELWRAAVEQLQAAEAQAIFRPYARYRLALAWLARGEREAAQREFDQAISGARMLGARLIEQHAFDAAELAGLAVEGKSRKRGPADSLQLTAREAQVLALISEGLSNRQIGERLFISTKTASVHVSAILRKLGASSRTEAAVLASSS